VRENEIVRRQK